MTGKPLQNKKIALVIAFRDFRDVEYFTPRDILAEAGAEIVTVSSEKGLALGADGGEAEVDLTASQTKTEDFEAVVFVGGPGMVKNLDNQDFQRIARECVSLGKVVGAICIAPVLLAKAGILQGKKATVWSGPLDKSAIKILKESGAEYSEENVVVDDKIVTASGPQAASEFGRALIRALGAR